MNWFLGLLGVLTAGATEAYGGGVAHCTIVPGTEAWSSQQVQVKAPQLGALDSGWYARYGKLWLGRALTKQK